MRYQEAANFCFDLRRFRMRPGTSSTAALLDAIQSPQDSLACVQIAGSNGKGSTVRLLESVLREAGLEVGRYTSPHLEDVRERIAVNGRKITETAVIEFVETVKPYITDRAATGDPPTFFEVLTAMALWEFERQNVDVAILEVGIGGKHDATSVVDPIASSVTNVTLEHTHLLGDTIGEIAADKAHVAPQNRPLVTGATGEALEAIEDQANDVLTVGTAAESEPSHTAPDVTTTYHGRVNHTEAEIAIEGSDYSLDTRLALLGEHQARNAGIAATIARQVGEELGVDLPSTTIETGLRKATWPGRFEVMDTEPLTILDGAHNPGAIEAVTDTLETFDYEDLVVVFGSMHEKDHVAMARALPDADTIFTTRPIPERSESHEVLAEVIERHTNAAVESRRSVVSAVDQAIETASPDDAVLVTGSLYTVSEGRRRWSQTIREPTIETIPEMKAELERAHVTEGGVWRMRGKGVSRVLSTRVQPQQAQYLKEELLSLGGECAISGLEDHDEELLDVVMMATLAQFKRLTTKLEGQTYGLDVFADELRATLGFGGQRRDAELPPGSGEAPWSERSAVMGILNVTPDSFHDGGRYETTDAALERADELISQGADIVDVGGESTRPGAEPVCVETEIERVVPVIEALAERDLLISIDTRKAAVADAAMAAGADIINDVSGLSDPEMRFVAADHDAILVVMHSIDAPVDPETETDYDDVVSDIIDTLSERVLLAEQAGLNRSQIVVDPGIGFGTSPRESFELLGRIDEFHALGCPVLVGHSHKSMFDAVGCGPDERTHATVGASALAAERGADIVRVHDVAESVAAIRTVEAGVDPSRLDT